jgi:hypothetical protein
VLQEHFGAKVARNGLKLFFFLQNKSLKVKQLLLSASVASLASLGTIVNFGCSSLLLFYRWLIGGFLVSLLFVMLFHHEII